MGAVPAYYAYPQRAPERVSQPRVRVVPGRRTQADTSRVPKIVACVTAIVIAGFLISMIRVAFTVNTVQTAQAAQQISSQIEEARSVGASLEVSQSTLSNPTKVKQQAEKLGMAAPTSVSVIELAPDVVVTNESGALSLSQSIDVAVTSGV